MLFHAFMPLNMPFLEYPPIKCPLFVSLRARCWSGNGDKSFRDLGELTIKKEQQRGKQTVTFR